VIDRAAVRAGHPSTLEDLGSGTALRMLAVAEGLDITGPDIVALAGAGDPAAKSAWNSVVEAVAIGASNMAHLFAPEVIVIGGGVGLTGHLLTDPVKAWLREHGPVGLPVDVSTAALGDDAGLAGAAAWAEAFLPRFSPQLIAGLHRGSGAL
jgi:glucokinase